LKPDQATDCKVFVIIYLHVHVNLTLSLGLVVLKIWFCGHNTFKYAMQFLLPNIYTILQVTGAKRHDHKIVSAESCPLQYALAGAFIF